jgi:predicted permease
MFGVPLLRGRDLLPTDDEKSPHVAVINETMAKAFWPGRDPIGQHFHRDWQGSPPIEVVGVVPTGKYIMLTEEPRPYFYAPFAQGYGMPASLVVRTSGDPRSLTHSLRQAVQSVDPDLPIYHLVTFEEHMASSAFGYMPLRMGATLAGNQGTLALLLAILGLYSVVSYGVSRRIREIGVRMALGATREDVVLLVSREGLRLTFIGLSVGLLMALLTSLALSRVLYGVHAADGVAFVIVIGVLVGTSALACALPALRATRVNPLEALRSE